VQRQAVAIALTSVGAVVVGTLILLSTTRAPLSPVLFEVMSAFGTVGLSQGMTATLPGIAQVVIIVLMFVGRLGPHTFGAAIALREHDRLYRFPEERPIIG
jgi:Trk-type K+ transport system membrane component